MTVVADNDLALRANARFLRFVLAKLLQVVAQNALIYGLFILVVAEQESAVATSAFILTAIVPSILFSLPGGVAADTLPVKFSLLSSMAARLLLVYVFIAQDVGIVLIIVLALVWWTISQLFGPAENAALPSIVEGERMAPANAVLDAVSLSSQLLGAGVIAPFTLKAFGNDGLFAIVLVLLVGSLLLYAFLPRLTPTARPKRRRTSWLRAMPEGLRVIRREPSLLRITTLRIILDTGLTIVAVAAPTFINDVLRTAPENAVYIFAPGALGLAAGLVIAPLLLKVSPPRPVTTLGFALLVGVVLTMPFIREIARELDERTFVPLQQAEDILRVRREIAGAVLLLPFGGLGISLVRVAARTAVYRYAPPEAVAQVFATQSALGSVVSPLPTLGAGLLVDWLDVRAVLLLTGSIMGGLAMLGVALPGLPAAAGPASSGGEGGAGVAGR